MISLDNGLSYNISTKSFHYMGHLPYSITGWDIYNQREKFMQILCEKRRQDIATYQELIDATWKRSSNEVQTVYKNIRDGLESQFWIRKSISSFCTNIPRVGYKLKMR
jgi:DNA-binding winged helix-turn-helix (wHTH) protein